MTNNKASADHLLTTSVPEVFPECSKCDDTGYKDHAGFALDPCPHGDPTEPLEQIVAEALTSREHGPVTASEIAKTIRAAGVDADFQSGVDRWMDACFGAAIKADQLERADRFIEEALELSQTFPAFTAERAHALVDYVFARSVGEPHQEVGGVMVTLAALCNTAGLSIHSAAYDELARVWTKVEAIRAKQRRSRPGAPYRWRHPPRPTQ
ncbi:hypothetical protein [Novosphingobium sp. AP12]|uniref:hypothetical protein n=1 Tax=Novosphingobium sp. AP12 TaxID=1144305 RepID=UPI0002721A34|nr:hypothetical protein [Novosphingobium sp. AP12]EJL23698.1 hypothetical protein PMI02_04041 [Novosphingobium sp. AP12]